MFNHDYEAMYFCQNFVFFRIIFIFFAKKAKIYALFASERNAKTKRNGREIFAKRFFLFAGNPSFKGRGVIKCSSFKILREE